MLLNTEDTYKTLQTFYSINEMNIAVKAHKRKYKREMTKATYEVLDFISQWACKYIGVCYLSKSKIAKELGINRRTVIRACQLLEELGIIVQYSTKRATGDRRRSTNAIVIQPIRKECHTEMSQLDTPSNTPIINNTDVTEEPSQNKVLSEALKSKLPKALQSVSYFFDTDTTYSIVGTIYKAKASIDKAISIEEHAQEFETTIKQVIQSYKMGKIRSFNGVIFSAIKSLCKSIKLKSQLNSVFGF